jgi:DNA-directed RNA polymerase subunit RPC12/RpoP
MFIMIKKCPKCGSENHHTELTSLSECPKCGVIYSKAKPPLKPSEKYPHEPYKPKSSFYSKIKNWFNRQTEALKVIYILVGYFGLLISIGFFLLDMPEKNNPTSSDFDSIPHSAKETQSKSDYSSISNKSETASGIPPKGEEALVVCKFFIEPRLSSPSTASFSSLFNSTITSVGIGSYRVTGYVDAQNAFGAKIRNHYICVVSRDGGGWILESLSLY